MKVKTDLTPHTFTKLSIPGRLVSETEQMHPSEVQNCTSLLLVTNIMFFYRSQPPNIIERCKVDINILTWSAKEVQNMMMTKQSKSPCIISHIQQTTSLLLVYKCVLVHPRIRIVISGVKKKGTNAFWPSVLILMKSLCGRICNREMEIHYGSRAHMLLFE